MDSLILDNFLESILIGVALVFLIWRIQKGIDSRKHTYTEKRPIRFKFPLSRGEIIFDFYSYYTGKGSIFIARYRRLLFLPLISVIIAGLIGVGISLFSGELSFELIQNTFWQYAAFPFYFFAVPMIIMGIGKALHFIIYPDLFYLLKGAELEHKKDPESDSMAVEAYMKALGIKPSSYAYFKLSTLQKLEDEEKLKLLNLSISHGLEFEPTDFFLGKPLRERFFLRTKLLDFEGALKDAHSLEKIFVQEREHKGIPTNPEFPAHFFIPLAYWKLGISKEVVGDFNAAIQTYEEGYRLDPNKSSFLFSIARLKHWQNEFEKSLEYYLKGAEQEWEYGAKKRKEKEEKGEDPNWGSSTNEFRLPKIVEGLLKNLGRYPKGLIELCNHYIEKYSLDEYQGHRMRSTIERIDSARKSPGSLTHYRFLYDIPNDPFEKEQSDINYYVWLQNRYFDLADYENAEKGFLIIMHNTHQDFLENRFSMIESSDMKRWLEIKVGLLQYQKALDMLNFYEEKSTQLVSNPEWCDLEEPNDLREFLRERAKIQAKNSPNNLP